MEKEQLVKNINVIAGQIKDFEKALSFLGEPKNFKHDKKEQAEYHLETITRLSQRLRRMYIIKMEAEAEVRAMNIIQDIVEKQGRKDLPIVFMPYGQSTSRELGQRDWICGGPSNITITVRQPTDRGQSEFDTPPQIDHGPNWYDDWYKGEILEGPEKDEI